MLVEKLIDRLLAAQGKRRIQDFLRDRKTERNIERSAFRITGNSDDAGNALRAALGQGHVTIAEIASLVDEIEENGSQHIFLFNLTRRGQQDFSLDRIARRFRRAPSPPTEQLYIGLPHNPMLYYREMPDGRIIVKEVSRRDYWKRSEDESSRTDTRRVDVWNLEAARAVNLLVIDLEEATIEVRIDRISHHVRFDQLFEIYYEFLAHFPMFEIGETVVAHEVWNGFPAIVRSREGTFIATDEAVDESVKHRLSSRRQAPWGTDIREHPAYDMDRENYTRDTLNVHWILDESGDSRVHTIISRVKNEDGVDLAKVYVGARVTPKELDDVLDRIRRSAS
jgi:hypothetical protein